MRRFFRPTLRRPLPRRRPIFACSSKCSTPFGTVFHRTQHAADKRAAPWKAVRRPLHRRQRRPGGPSGQRSFPAATEGPRQQGWILRGQSPLDVARFETKHRGWNRCGHAFDSTPSGINALTAESMESGPITKLTHELQEPCASPGDHSERRALSPTTPSFAREAIQARPVGFFRG